jgi:hypothetical protein
MTLSIRVEITPILLLFGLAALPANACLNDRDTARTEQLHALSIADDTAGANNAARVLTGRFERNPASYYRMRIARLTTWLKENPDDIDGYDDIAVAFDRIGKDSSAIAWIETKGRQLEAQSGKQTDSMPFELRERWYRYYANRGTFRVHQWIRAGADPKKISAVRQAHDDIERALMLNSHAHFGRERVQARVMQWILDMDAPKPPANTPLPLGDYLGGINDHTRPANGLVGLIELGGAWESIDVYDAIATLSRNNRPGVALFAAERVRELLAAGRHSLFPRRNPDSLFDTNAGYVESKLSMRPLSAGRTKFLELRVEAETWNLQRAAYMEARMARGTHPDTDAAFWSGWLEPRPPSLELPFRERLIYTVLRPWFWGPLAWLAGATIAVSLWRRLRRRSHLFFKIPHD